MGAPLRSTGGRREPAAVRASSSEPSRAVERALLVTASLGFVAARVFPSPLLVGRVTGAACWVHALLGIPCPTCGLTRALMALAHGDVRAALVVQPLATVAALLAVAYLPWAAGVVWGGWRPLRISASGVVGRRVRVALVVVVVLNWAYLIRVGV